MCTHGNEMELKSDFYFIHVHKYYLLASGALLNERPAGKVERSLGIKQTIHNAPKNNIPVALTLP